MKRLLSSFAILLFPVLLAAQPASPVIMHRIQDTTKDKAGLYYGKSTEGHFSVLLPVPFNDFTVKTNGVTTYVIGSKSKEGIKFSVTEVSKKDTGKTIDFDAIVAGFNRSSNTVENVKKEKTATNESVSFSVSGQANGALCKYVNTRNRLFTMIIEFPMEYKAMVAKDFGYFFSSLRISMP